VRASLPIAANGGRVDTASLFTFRIQPVWTVSHFFIPFSLSPFPFLWPRGASEGDRRIRGIPWRIIAGDEERSRVDLTVACRACRAIHPLQGVCTRKGRKLL